jgi:high affinity sulfate transporter 1
VTPSSSTSAAGPAARLASAWVPGLAAARNYQRSWLAKDAVAGLVLTALLVPQGMAYAELAGLPPVTGLYTSILCLLGYAVFGPSRILVLGPDSALGPMIAATVLPLAAANGDPETAVLLASMLALLVGAFMVLAGVAKLGLVADLLSKPTRIGYMNGLAITIVVGQLPKLFGFSVDGDSLISELRGFVQGVYHGETVAASLAVGCFALVVILVLQRWFRKIPAVLAAVVLSIVASVVFGLADHGVSLVGVLPQGFPPFTIPHVALSSFPVLVAGAIGISLVALTDTISTATAFAARSGQEVNANQEMVGIGAANLAAGLFQGFPVSTSGSRTAVAEQSGAKSQLAGVVGAVTITVMLLVLPGLLKNLPSPTLAAVVIAAALSLADLAGTRRLWHQRRTEWVISIAAFLGVALLGVLPGIALAVVMSILNVFRRAWWPYQPRLGQVDDLSGLHDVSRYDSARELDGLIVFRFDAPLFFANARAFREHVRHLASADPAPHWVLLAAEPVTDVDTTAADVLHDLDEELASLGVTLMIAELKDPVREQLRQYGLGQAIEDGRFFRTLDNAVAAYRAAYPEARWRDADPVSGHADADPRPGQEDSS